MSHSIIKSEPFNKHANEYDEWYEKYPHVFKSEVEAVRNMLPKDDSYGIEVGLGTGRFSVALGIKEGVEPAKEMIKIAKSRGLEVMEGVAESLPYKDLRFDFVVMVSSINYFYDLQAAFHEAHRVLKKGGILVIGFIVKNSIIGNYYEQNRNFSIFQKQATFYTIPKLISEIKSAGFNRLHFTQTLFKKLDDIKEFEPAEPGFDKGSFIVIKASKR